MFYVKIVQFKLEVEVELTEASKPFMISLFLH